MNDKIRQLMDERNVTPYKVAKDTGIANSSISEWLNGKYNPKPDKLKILADYFGVSIEYFMD